MPADPTPACKFKCQEDELLTLFGKVIHSLIHFITKTVSFFSLKFLIFIRFSRFVPNLPAVP